MEFSNVGYEKKILQTDTLWHVSDTYKVSGVRMILDFSTQHWGKRYRARRQQDSEGKFFQTQNSMLTQTIHSHVKIKTNFLLLDMQSLRIFLFIISYDATRKHTKYRMGTNQEKRTVGYGRTKRRSMTGERWQESRCTRQGGSQCDSGHRHIEWPSPWHFWPLSLCLTWQYQSVPVQILICTWLV